MIRALATLISSELAARALQAAGFFVLARRVSTEEMSRYGLAVSLLAYLLLIVFPALDLAAVRRAARGEANLAATVATLVRLRLPLAAAAMTMAAIYSAAAGDWLLAVLAASAGAAAINPRWALQAVDAPAALGVAQVTAQAAFVAGVLLAPAGAVLFFAAAAQTLGEFAAAGWCWLALRQRRGALAGGAPAEWTGAGSLAAEAWPLQVSLFLGVMMYNFDVLMLGWLGKRAEIAFYLAAYRFVTVFSPVFAAVQTALYPRLSRAFPDFAGVRAETVKLAAALALGCGGVALGLAYFGRAALALLYGDAYAGAQPILAILAWVLPVQALRIVARQVTMAWGAAAGDPWRVLAAVAVNAGADLALIPRWGAVGAAWSTLAAEATLMLLMAGAARRRL